MRRASPVQVTGCGQSLQQLNMRQPDRELFLENQRVSSQLHTTIWSRHELLTSAFNLGNDTSFCGVCWELAKRTLDVTSAIYVPRGSSQNKYSIETVNQQEQVKRSHIG